MIKRSFFSLVQWIKSTLFQSHLYRYKLSDDLPESLENRTIYVQGNYNPWLASMLCPCGCGDVLHINLIPTRKPVWGIQLLPNGLVSLQPSLWKKTGCKSHFYLKKGRINWV